MPDRAEFQMHNRKAAFLWGFMAIWFGMLSMFVYLYVTKPLFGEQGQWMPIGLGLFFIFGIGGMKWAFGHPIVSLRLADGRAQIRELYAFRVESTTCLADEISVLPIREDKDSDGDPYFKLEITVREKTFLIWESHSREETTEKRSALLLALKP
jgi:hypothetical protein